jgi:hypothetical protein
MIHRWDRFRLSRVWFIDLVTLGVSLICIHSQCIEISECQSEFSRKNLEEYALIVKYPGSSMRRHFKKVIMKDGKNYKKV